jgi:hypothetical protein
MNWVQGATLHIFIRESRLFRRTHEPSQYPALTLIHRALILSAFFYTRHALYFLEFQARILLLGITIVGVGISGAAVVVLVRCGSPGGDN